MKKRHEVTSTLMSVVHQLPTELEKAQAKVIAHLKKSQVNEDSKRKMIFTVKNMVSREELERYLWNCVLAYEGLRVRSFRV